MGPTINNSTISQLESTSCQFNDPDTGTTMLILKKYGVVAWNGCTNSADGRSKIICKEDEETVVEVDEDQKRRVGEWVWSYSLNAYGRVVGVVFIGRCQCRWEIVIINIMNMNVCITIKQRSLI